MYCPHNLGRFTKQGFLFGLIGAAHIFWRFAGTCGSFPSRFPNLSDSTVAGRHMIALLNRRSRGIKLSGSRSARQRHQSGYNFAAGPFRRLCSLSKYLIVFPLFTAAGVPFEILKNENIRFQSNGSGMFSQRFAGFHGKELV